MSVISEGFVRGASLKLIQHPVNHHTGNANVKPEGKGPPGDFSMGGKTAAKRPRKRDEHQRNNRAGERNVARKQREINSPDIPLGREMNVAIMSVEPKIDDKEGDRDAEAGEHEAFVRKDALPANHGVSAS